MKRPRLSKNAKIRILALLVAVFGLVALVATANASPRPMVEGHAYGQAKKPRPTTTTPPPTTVPPTTTTTPPLTTTPPPSGGVCTSPVWVTSDPSAMQMFNGYWVANGVWNPVAGATQTMYACSEKSWYVEASGFPDNNFEVFSYPNSHLDFSWPSGTALSSFSTISSTFSGFPTGTGYFNAGYDIWINGAGWSCGNTEVMVWTETSGSFNPLGTDRGDYVAPDGQVYDVFYYNDGCMEVISYKSRTTQRLGVLNLRDLLNDAIARNYVASSDGLVQVDYGVEIRHTVGTFRFDVTDFTVTAN